MKYLILFSQDSHWLDFRLAELKALLSMFELESAISTIQEFENLKSAFYSIELPNDEYVHKLLSRSVTIKAIYELWAYSDNMKSLLNDINSNFHKLLKPYILSKSTWSLQVESTYVALTPEDKQFYRSMFQCLHTLGPVDVKNPQVNMSLLLDFSKKQNKMEVETIPAYFGRLVGMNGMRHAINKYDLKKRLYLGPTSLDTSLSFIMANLVQAQEGDFVLDPFVGTASILVALSHLNCHCFGTDIDSRVLRGNMYAGQNREHRNKKTVTNITSDNNNITNDTSNNTNTDNNNDNNNNNIDTHLIVEKEIKRDIYTTFKAYDLIPPELIRLDNHISDKHYHIHRSMTSSTPHSPSLTPSPPSLISTSSPTQLASSALSPSSSSSDVAANISLYKEETEGFFDIIVTDPPYGIRAGAKKSGKKGGVTYTIDNTDRQEHIPSTQIYPVEEVMLDLLHTASRVLVIGGRLIYLIPTTYDFEVSDLPIHPCLDLIEICEQPLSSRHGRRAVVMKKVRSYTPTLEEEFYQYKSSILTSTNTTTTTTSTAEVVVTSSGFGNLMNKLNQALAVNAYYNDQVVKRASEGCKRRKQNVLNKIKKKQEMMSQQNDNNNLSYNDDTDNNNDNNNNNNNNSNNMDITSDNNNI